jgi:SAM-dependent methyltransferase
MNLLGEDQLERSWVVANCRMNRERNLAGSNGYAKEIGFDPLDFLTERVASNRTIAWLDLCCGTGRALIQAARIVHTEGLEHQIKVVGVDLVGMFAAPVPDQTCLRLVEASVRVWRPERPFDLITCIHGLHYVGDKLGLIARAASWLTEYGTFVANLDLANLKLTNGQDGNRPIASAFRSQKLEYDGGKRRVVCRGKKTVEMPYRYRGADDGAGSNYTGQPAVNSYYEKSGGAARSRRTAR